MPTRRVPAAVAPSTTAVLEDYAEALRHLPERVLIECHRVTERRIQDILAGRRQVHDVTIIEDKTNG